MTGRLRDDATVRFEDPAEASNIYGKGFFGTPESGGGLTLDRYEAVYLAEMSRAEIVGLRGRPVPWPEVFRRAVRSDGGFSVRYLVYRDLRQRGYVVRASGPPVAFAVLPRGGILHKTPSRFWIEAISEREPFDLTRLFELADRGQSAKKVVLLAVVDEELDLTYYRVRRPSPTGAVPLPPLAASVEGWLSVDRVTVHDSVAAEALGKALAYGSRIGDRLELSLLESAYLASTGQLTLRDATSGRAVPRSAARPRATSRPGVLRTSRGVSGPARTSVDRQDRFQVRGPFPRLPSKPRARPRPVPRPRGPGFPPGALADGRRRGTRGAGGPQGVPDGRRGAGGPGPVPVPRTDPALVFSCGRRARAGLLLAADHGAASR